MFGILWGGMSDPGHISVDTEEAGGRIDGGVGQHPERFLQQDRFIIVKMIRGNPEEASHIIIKRFCYFLFCCFYHFVFILLHNEFSVFEVLFIIPFLPLKFS